jgi:hypothetical protein
MSHVYEWLRLPDGTRSEIGLREQNGNALAWPGTQRLREFRLENGLPVWRYELPGASFEKRVLMPHRQNTAYVTYRLVSGQGTVRLKLRPALHLRPLEGPVHEPIATPIRSPRSTIDSSCQPQGRIRHCA